MHTNHSKAFTLIEVLLTVAALVIILSITIMAINVPKHLADTRNAERRVDVSTILNAIHQYALDNHGSLPGAIPTGTLSDCTTKTLDATFTICRTGGCSLVLTELTNNSTYLTDIPVDPTSNTADYSGYNVIKDTDRNNTVTVCAPAAENGEVLYAPH